ncbi:hypothetical protein KK078_09380, partial [Fulvivirgaceae bacterium PWU37]|nr:hypothetical protein [Dawidia soli]
MSAPNFIDYVKFCSRSGKGGAGCLHFHREKFIQKGGPDGGDGGRGGSVILRGDAQHWTLLHLKYRKHVIASNGNPGEEQDRTGASGKDEIIPVPLGTGMSLSRIHISAPPRLLLLAYARVGLQKRGRGGG